MKLRRLRGLIRKEFIQIRRDPSAIEKTAVKYNKEK